MVYASIVRENDVGSVDTLTTLGELAGGSPGAIQVPTKAHWISEVRIGAGADWTADAAYGFSSAVHLTGGGLPGGVFNFPGPYGGTAGATNISPGNKFNLKPVIYHCNIPVNPNGEIDVQGAMAGEDAGNIHLAVQIVFDGPPGPIRCYDYREESLTAANTLVTLAARAGTASQNFKVPTIREKPVYLEICEVSLGAGVKAVAGPLRTVMHAKLTGSGFVDSETRDFIGNGGGVQDDGLSVAGDSWFQHPIVNRTNIAVKQAGEIIAEAQELEDDVGTLFAFVGLGYR